MSILDVNIFYNRGGGGRGAALIPQVVSFPPRMSLLGLCTQIYGPGPESFEAESLYTRIVSAPFSLRALVPNLNPSPWEAGNPVPSRVISILS